MRGSRRIDIHTVIREPKDPRLLGRQRRTEGRPAATAPQGRKEAAAPRKGGRPAATAPRRKSTAAPRQARSSRREDGPPPPPPGERQSSNALHTPAQFRRGLTHHARPGRPDAWIPFSGTSCPNMHCSNCCSATATARALREELTDTLHSTAPVSARQPPHPRGLSVSAYPLPLDRPPVVAGPTAALHRESALPCAPWLWPC